MANGVGDGVVVGSGGAGAGVGFESLAGVSDGFLGTGYSASVEVSFIGMALIGAYVAISTARYFLHGTRVLAMVAGALGLQDD